MIRLLLVAVTSVRTLADRAGLGVRGAPRREAVREAYVAWAGVVRVGEIAGRSAQKVEVRSLSAPGGATVAPMAADFTVVKTQHVRTAMAKCDALGLKHLVPGRKFGEALEYVLLCDGRAYPSKAIMFAAYYEATGDALPENMSGGEKVVNQFMRQAGPFEGLSVVPEKRSNPPRSCPDWFESAEDESSPSDAFEPVLEGATVERITCVRSRSRRARQSMIDAMRLEHGRVFCTVCGLVPGDLYGAVADDVVDVHHVTPLYVSGETETKPDGLAVVCPTCHRALHRHDPIVQPEQLRATVEARRVFRDGAR